MPAHDPLTEVVMVAQELCSDYFRAEDAGTIDGDEYLDLLATAARLRYYADRAVEYVMVRLVGGQ